jgi:hypothetical protein
MHGRVGTNHFERSQNLTLDSDGSDDHSADNVGLAGVTAGHLARPVDDLGSAVDECILPACNDLYQLSSSAGV